jgi:hypothetical protein
MHNGGRSQAENPNPYVVLGVAETASARDITIAYRKLARQCHPDKHPDQPEKAELFKNISAAYEILVDEEKRAEFDNIQDDDIFDVQDYSSSGDSSALVTTTSLSFKATLELADLSDNELVKLAVSDVSVARFIFNDKKIFARLSKTSFTYYLHIQPIIDAHEEIALLASEDPISRYPELTGLNVLNLGKAFPSACAKLLSQPAILALMNIRKINELRSYYADNAPLLALIDEAEYIKDQLLQFADLLPYLSNQEVPLLAGEDIKPGVLTLLAKTGLSNSDYLEILRRQPALKLAQEKNGVRVERDDYKEELKAAKQDEEKALHLVRNAKHWGRLTSMSLWTNSNDACKLALSFSSVCRELLSHHELVVRMPGKCWFALQEKYASHSAIISAMNDDPEVTKRIAAFKALQPFMPPFESLPSENLEPNFTASEFAQYVQLAGLKWTDTKKMAVKSSAIAKMLLETSALNSSYLHGLVIDEVVPRHEQLAISYCEPTSSEYGLRRLGVSLFNCFEKIMASKEMSAVLRGEDLYAAVEKFKSPALTLIVNDSDALSKYHAYSRIKQASQRSGGVSLEKKAVKKRSKDEECDLLFQMANDALKNNNDESKAQAEILLVRAAKLKHEQALTLLLTLIKDAAPKKKLEVAVICYELGQMELASNLTSEIENTISTEELHEMIAGIEQAINDMSQNEDPDLEVIGNFYFEVVSTLADSDKFADKRERGELFRLLANMFLGDIELPEIALRYLQKIPTDEQTVADLYNLADLTMSFLVAKQLTAKAAELPEEQRAHVRSKGSAKVLKQPKLIAERISKTLPYRLKAADMDETYRSQATSMQDQAIQLHLEPAEKGEMLRHVALAYIAISANWQEERVLPLLKHASRLGDAVADFCIEHLASFNQPYFKMSMLAINNFSGHSDDLLALLTAVEGLPANYQAARKQLQSFLEGNIDQELYELRQARIANLHSLEVEIAQRSGYLKAIFEKIADMAEGNYNAGFLAKFKLLLQLGKVELKKYLNQDFSAADVDADKSALSNILLKVAKRHTKEMDMVVKAKRDCAKEHYDICRELAAEFAPHFPAVAHHYLLQLPNAIQTLDDVLLIADSAFELDENKAERYKLAMPYCFKAADMKRKLTPQMDAKRAKLLAFTMPPEEKANLLMQISWDYIDKNKRWQKSRVLPLWEEAARCGNPIGKFCFENAFKFEASPFYFAGVRELIKSHESHLEKVAPLLLRADALPSHYQAIRAQLLACFSSDYPLSSLHNASAHLQALEELVRRHHSLTSESEKLIAKFQALHLALEEKARQHNLAGQLTLKQEFTERAKVIQQICATFALQLQVQGYYAKDFSQADVLSDENNFANKLVSLVSDDLNRLININKKQAKWCKRTLYVFSTECQVLFPDSQICKTLPVKFNAFKSDLKSLGAKDPIVSFFTKHRSAIIILSLGLLGFGLTAATGGLAAGWLAALPWIVKTAVYLSTLTSVTLTAAALTNTLVASASLVSFAFFSSLSYGIKTLALRFQKKEVQTIDLSEKPAAPKKTSAKLLVELSNGEQVSAKHVEQVRTRLSNANFTQAELKDLYEAANAPGGKTNTAFNPAWFKSFGVFSGNAEKVGSLRQTKQIIRTMLATDGSNFTLVSRT